MKKKGGEKMTQFLKRLGIVLIILAILIPIGYSIFCLERLKFLEASINEWSNLTEMGRREIIEYEEIKYIRKILLIVTLPSGIILGIFWLSISEVLDKLEKINQNLSLSIKTKEKQYPILHE